MYKVKGVEEKGNGPTLEGLVFCFSK